MGSFQQIYQAPTRDLFGMLLRKCHSRAEHRCIEPGQEAVYTIQRHWTGVVNWIDFNIRNIILEGLNSIFQAAKNKVRGYPRTDTIKTVIYLYTNKLDFSKINP